MFFFILYLLSSLCKHYFKICYFRCFCRFYTLFIHKLKQIVKKIPNFSLFFAKKRILFFSRNFNIRHLFSCALFLPLFRTYISVLTAFFFLFFSAWVSKRIFIHTFSRNVRLTASKANVLGCEFTNNSPYAKHLKI